MSTLQCQNIKSRFLFSVPEYTWNGKLANYRHTMIYGTMWDVLDQGSIYADADVYQNGRLIGRVTFGVYASV